ncbi:MAG TPA: DNA repair protein RecO [Cyclobacteriaceae bacterium]|nr:DNA repair protein RecO [Cyclobacteriaceae bacterium]
MQIKTRGIVLNYIRYSESSVITKIYTEQYGLQTYIVNNVRSAKPKYTVALFQPMTQLDMVVYHNYYGKINRVSEIRISHPYRDLPFNIRKSTVALFLSEMLLKTLREESSNPELYHFIISSFTEYDALRREYQNFHVQFLLHYLKYIGLEPVTLENLRAGNRRNNRSAFHDTKLLHDLLHEPYGSDRIRIGKKDRLDILELITGFLIDHLGIEDSFKSLKVLTEVFD